MIKIVGFMKDESTRKAFGLRLKQLRKDKGLTQKELAALIEIGPSQFNKYELGIFEPPIEKMIRLAEHLNVSLDYLILGEAQKQLEFKNRELLNKLSDIEKLSQDDQQALLRMIDALIVQQKVESAVKKK